jgi:GTP cyclohydrolase I
MMMRGVEKQNSIMTTSTVLGNMHDEAAARAEFMGLISRNLG